MGSVQVSHVGWKLPSGHSLLDDVSFRVGPGERVALVGANGVGKTTLLRLAAGEVEPTTGTVSVDGRLGVMQQLTGLDAGTTTVRDLLVSVAPVRIREVAHRLDRARLGAATDPMRYATALAEWGDAGGYAIEVLWDECVGRVLGGDLGAVADRPLSTLSGGEHRSGRTVG